MAKVLLEGHHARVNAHSFKMHFSPFLLAIAEGHHKMVTLLVQHGADINDTSARFMDLVFNPMMLAVNKNAVMFCRLLLDSLLDKPERADINFFHWSMTSERN